MFDLLKFLKFIKILSFLYPNNKQLLNIDSTITLLQDS